jgi:hypothetical protein
VRPSAFLALCSIACAGEVPHVLAGNWSGGSVDFTISMNLQGTPDNLHGTGVYRYVAGGGDIAISISGTEKHLVWIWEDGRIDSMSVWFLDPDSVFSEIAYAVPATGTCDPFPSITFRYDQCIASCLPDEEVRAGGSPAGYCFRRTR